jgi:hypothetical protein
LAGKPSIGTATLFRPTRPPHAVSVPSGDSEAIHLYEEITDALDKAGWKGVDWTGVGVFYERPGRPKAGLIAATGVHLIVLPDADNKDHLILAARAVAEGLTKIGIASQAVEMQMQNSSTNHNSIQLVIGTKPY